MKTLCVLIACMAVFSTGYGQRKPDVQLQFGFKAGMAPSRVMGTAPLIVNRSDRDVDFLFNGTRVEFSPALGVALKLRVNQFFFAVDATYSSLKKTYAMQYIDESTGPEYSHHMEESCKTIELPVSAGVSLGHVEITSGFSARYEFGQSSSLSQMPGFSRELQSTVFGWHSGIGLNFGKITTELRYQQDFANYGQGIYANGEELLLRNSPSQLRFMVGLWF